MRRICAVFVAVMIVVGFSGCSLWNSIFGTTFPGMAGKLLSVDGKKHFQEDIKYHQWGEIHTYNKNGTFEIDNFYNQSTTQILQDWGLRGTYTYDPDTFTMTLTATQEYNSGRAPDAWYIYPATVTHTATGQQYCAEHEFGWIYKETGANWVFTWVHAGGDSSQQAPNSWQYTITETYALAEGTAGYSFNRTEVQQSGSNPPVTHRSETRIGDAELFPAGAKFEKGNSVTVHAKLTTYRTQSWDSVNNVLGAPQDQTLRFEDRTFECMGDYIIEFPYAASRDMGE
jgi:hypothetical protein